MLTGFEKLLLPDILYEWLAILAHLDEQAYDLCPGLGGQVVEVGEDSTHGQAATIKIEMVNIARSKPASMYI